MSELRLATRSVQAPVRLIGLALSFLLLLSAAPAASATGQCRDPEAAVRRAANNDTVDLTAVEGLYDGLDGRCAWSEANAEALISAIKSSAEQGLDPALFHAEAFTEAVPSSDDAAADRDVLLSDAAIKYAVALSRGLSAPFIPTEDRPAHSRPNQELIDGLVDALLQGTVTAWVQSLPPQNEPYARLKSALATYRSIAEAGGWESLPEVMPKKGKRRAAFVADLRRRLAIEGDLTFDDGSTVYNEALEAAVTRFQERNGLRANGRVDGKTIERLNVSAAERVARIAVNMERFRASDRDLPATRVEVNAPAATAALYRDGAPVLKMNAVVGAPGHDTPMLTSMINTIVVNPPWNVPNSIVENEIRPLLRRNKDYLTKNRMYWSGDQLIQEPGPQNALGRIKFEFPNRFSVYLHDTPARRLFTDPERAQSHGCVRLERPLDLAEELLRGDPNWNREAIEQAIREGDTKRIPVTEPVPVVITYQTAFVAEDGLVQFRPDIYGMDTQLTLALAQRAGSMRSEPAQW